MFKEFKELSWGGNVIAPINKERLETELGIRFRAFGTGWRYDWQSDGMLARVVRPDGKEVSFAYDALGRRIRKSFAGTTTHFVWDGNVPLHEWTEESEMVTWLFEQDTFVPAAKLVANGECFSIISDYLGTPLQAYDKQGNKVWEQELDIYGRQRKRPSAFIPFKYQGQYEDAETGLYYNRFRYYDPNAGSYVSQDPLRFETKHLDFYCYVHDTNIWIDVFGLLELFRSVSRSEFFDMKNSGWRPNGGSMEGKWFAENFDDAVTWGKTMGHGTDTKFYVVKVEVPDDIAEAAFKHTNLDGIGNARYIEVDDLNKYGEVKQVNSVRAGNH